MSSIPLDLQKRCERRWATKFVRPVPPVVPKQVLAGQDQQQLAAPTEGKKPAGLRPERGTEALD
jgi:hypothetical protein